MSLRTFESVALSVEAEVVGAAGIGMLAGLIVFVLGKPLLMGRINDELTHLARGADAFTTLVPLIAAWMGFGFFTIAVLHAWLLAVLALREFPHPVVWPAAALTLGGIWLLSGGALSGLTEGDLWTLLCAVLWACHVIALGRFVKGAPRR